MRNSLHHNLIPNNVGFVHALPSLNLVLPRHMNNQTWFVSGLFLIKLFIVHFRSVPFCFYRPDLNSILFELKSVQTFTHMEQTFQRSNNAHSLHFRLSEFNFPLLWL